MTTPEQIVQMTRDQKIIFSLWFGLTPVTDLDDRFFRDHLDVGGLSQTTKSKQRKKEKNIRHDLTAMVDIINNIHHLYIDSGVEGIRALFANLRLNSMNATIRKGQNNMLNHCSPKIEERLQVSAKLRSKQGQILEGQFRLIFNRMESEAWAELAKKRQRDRRNKVMRRLIAQGFVNRMELPPALREEFGDAAFFLSQTGADHLAQFANLQRERIRAYKFYVHTAKHEIITARVLRSIVMQQEQQGYKITELYDEPKVRKIFHTRKRNFKAIPDLVFVICAQRKRHEFWVEIDCGSQPISKLIHLTRIKLGLIVVTTSKDIALRRRHELIKSPDTRTPFFITTADRIVKRSLFDSGYITKERDQFCMCEQLVVDTDKGIVRDKYGCVCIRSYLYSPDQGKLEQTKRDTTKPEPIEALPPAETHQPAPPPAVKTARKQVAPKKQEITILSLSISNWLWLAGSMSLVYFDAKYWRLFATFVDWIEKFF